jgi:hypothetical protein
MNYNTILCNEKRIIKLRYCYGKLDDLCENLNQIYNTILFCFLILRNITMQFELYTVLKNVFNIIILNEEVKNETLSFTRWLFFEVFRIMFVFSICVAVEREVSI